MDFVDMESWPRREIFDFFSAVGKPFTPSPTART